MAKISCGTAQKRLVKADERRKDLEDKWRNINELNKVQYVSRKKITSIGRQLSKQERKVQQLESKRNSLCG